MPTLRERSDGGDTVARKCSTCNLRCGRFFILCNECNKWYFFSCHEITKDMAEQMSRFYCLPCRRKNPSLHVKETRHEKDVKIAWSECNVLRHEWEQLQDGRQRRRRPVVECERPEKCICSVPNECSPCSIQCQRCCSWSHYECEGFTFKTGKEISAYYCHHCRYYYDLSIEYRTGTTSHSSEKFSKRPRTSATNDEGNDIINVDNPGQASSSLTSLTVVNSGKPSLQSEASNQPAKQKAPHTDHPRQSQPRAAGVADAQAAELLASRTRIIRFGQIFRGKNRFVHANSSSIRELQLTINQKNAVIHQLRESAKQQAEELQWLKDESGRITDEKNSEIRDLQEMIASSKQLGQSTSKSSDVRCDHDAEIQRLKEENQQLATKVRDREAVIVRLTLAANGFHS